MKGVDISIPAKWDAVSFVNAVWLLYWGGIIDWEVGPEVLVVVWMWIICKFNLR